MSPQRPDTPTETPRRGRGRPRQGRNVHAPHWSREEVALLVREWGAAARTLRTALRAIGPGRSWCAIVQKAVELKLPFGTPQGCVTLRAAAIRTGYAVRTLQRILDAHGVTVHLHPTPVNRRKTPHGWTSVEWDQVEAAVKAYLATETIAAAAKTRGLSASTLRTWLLEAGVHQLGARGVPVRIATATIDRVVRERGYVEGGKTLRAVAAEVGLDPRTVAQRLARTGHTEARSVRGRRVYLNPATLHDALPELDASGEAPRRAA